MAGEGGEKKIVLPEKLLLQALHAAEFRAVGHLRARVDDRVVLFDAAVVAVPLLISPLAGGGSVEELRIPARSFSGMGLRLLDVEKRVWSDHWVNARSGVLYTPGETGGFVDGVGMFSSTYEENGRVTISAGIWDAITPQSCRWRQVVSEDGGSNWRHTWIMRWSRVGA